MNKYVEKIKPFFPDAHLYKENEIILESKNNISFRVDNIKSDLEFDCKMLEWVSRPSCKGLTPYWIKWFRRGLNSYFRKSWTPEDMQQIYTRLGNEVNRDLTIEFVHSDFNMSVFKQ